MLCTQSILGQPAEPTCLSIKAKETKAMSERRTTFPSVALRCGNIIAAKEGVGLLCPAFWKKRLVS